MKQLDSLTSLRFFAALFVVASHLQFFRTSDSPTLRAIYRVFYEGYTGVTFFFVLSGFILAHSYTDRLKAGLRPVEFWIARAARIYPLHLVTLAAALPLALWAAYRKDTWGTLLTQMAAHLSMTQAFVPDRSVYFSLNMPAWSLSVEFFFYALFPLLIAAGSRLLLLAVLAVVASHLMLAGRSDSHFLLYVFPVLRVGDFITGILLYRLWLAWPSVTANTASALQVGSLVVMIAFYAASSFAPQDLRYDVYYLAPMAFVVLACAWQQGIVSRVLSKPRLVELGEASFALYLVHQLVIRYGEMARPDGVAAEALFAVGYVLVSLKVSWWLFRHFETPAKMRTLAWLRRIATSAVPGRQQL